MGRRHTISIADGEGKIEIVDGTYKATGVAAGYDTDTFSPENVTIVSGTNEYVFTISASGTLTLHVTDTGEEQGVQVVGAKFVRTDSTGTVVGPEAVTNASGDAIFNNVPFSNEGKTLVYFKQIISDGAHTFDSELKSIGLKIDAETHQIKNPPAPERKISLVDANFASIPIKEGQVILEESD